MRGPTLEERQLPGQSDFLAEVACNSGICINRLATASVLIVAPTRAHRLAQSVRKLRTTKRKAVRCALGDRQEKTEHRFGMRKSARAKHQPTRLWEQRSWQQQAQLQRDFQGFWTV